MDKDWPTPPQAFSPGAVALLSDLHGNLWASLRHTLDTDKVTLGALWLSNLGGMALMIVATGLATGSTQPNRWPLAACIISLGVINAFIYRIFYNSQMEARRIIALLADLYADHGLAQYFDQLREDYFVERYKIRLVLCPVLFVLALILGISFGGGL